MSLKRFIQKYQYLIILFIWGLILFVSPVKAQDFNVKNYLPELNIQKNFFLSNQSNNITPSDCVKFDGKCQFSIAAPYNELQQRRNILEKRLYDISKHYFLEKEANLEIKIREVDNLQDIYIYINEGEYRLMTVTNWDAEIDKTTIINKAQLIKIILENNFPIAKKERTISFLIQQGIISSIIIVFIILMNFLISRWIRRLRQSRERLIAENLDFKKPIYTQFTNRKQINFDEVKYRLLQLLSLSIWLFGIILLLGLFPYTRFLQGLIIIWLRIPIIIGIVSILTYILIRLSYALINQFAYVIVNDFGLNSLTNERLQIRVTTVSSIIRSIVTITLLGGGIIFVLYLMGVNIGPILTGLGIFSLALSLGSQNLIKDAINGFLIIWEDQYAVGDVIKVNDVSGLVEKINLRITQLRDAEGGLITIPNGEVQIVANLSSQWARADVNIPISYNTNVDEALNLITEIAEKMSKDINWQDNIIEQPEILGVDKFANHGLMIKVWIKTKPLKQWLVSREFRRRLVIAFEEAGIPLVLPQQEIWLHNSILAENKGQEEGSSDKI